VRTVNIEISGARSLEHAMDQAIEQAETKCHQTVPDYKTTHRLNRVRFIMLTAECSYRDKNFIYYFEADLEDL
jgi:hypothetical protein